MCLRANNQRENTRAYLFLCAQGCFKPGVSGLARLTFIRKHRLDLGGARPSQGLKEGWGGDEAETRWEARELFSLQVGHPGGASSEGTDVWGQNHQPLPSSLAR